MWELGGVAYCAYCGVPVLINSERRDDGEVTFTQTRWHEDLGCLDEDGPAHLDHVIPESRNGPTSLDNTVIACAPCNMAKGDSALGDPGFLEWLAGRRRMIEAHRRGEMESHRRRVIGAHRIEAGQ